MSFIFTYSRPYLILIISSTISVPHGYMTLIILFYPLRMSYKVFCSSSPLPQLRRSMSTMSTHPTLCSLLILFGSPLSPTDAVHILIDVCPSAGVTPCPQRFAARLTRCTMWISGLWRRHHVFKIGLVSIEILNPVRPSWKPIYPAWP